MVTEASYLIVRADDHLVAGVRWSGFTRADVDAEGVPILIASAQARLVLLLPPQHVGEETSPKDSMSPLKLPAGATGGMVPGWRGVLSGGSRVAFSVAASTRIRLSAEDILAAIANSPLLTSSGVPGAEQTAIELPWRLLIMPRGRSATGAVVCRHSALPVVSGQVSGLWRTRLVDASNSPDLAGPDAGLTLRVADEAMAATADPTYAPAAPNNSIPLRSVDRTRVFTETRTRPASVTRLELSALGGTLDAKGTWPNFEWEHHAVLGRDMTVRTLAKGAMYPLGHRAQFFEVSERRFDPTAADTAVLRTVSVLTIVEPIRHPPANGPIQRAFPMGDVEITTTTFADLARPEYQSTTLPGGVSVQTHFWPTTLSGTKVRFPIRCATSTGDIRFELPLLFVADKLPDVDTLASPDLARRLASDYGEAKASLPAVIIDLVGSANRAQRANADAHEVHSITVAGVAEGLDLRDGYRSALTELEVSLPALRVLLGDDQLSKVRFATKYLQNGTEDVILNMPSTGIREIDFSTAADKSGGLVAPQYVTDAISRTLGPVSLRALPNPATGLINPASLFPSDQATLLGFPLKSLLTQLKLPPEITSIPIPGSAPEVRMQWRDVALRSIGPFVASSITRLDLDITAGANHAATVCTLKEFALELPPGPKRVLRLSFKELKFTQHNGSSPTVAVSGVDVTFLGELELLKKLQDAVDLGATGNIIDVRPSGITVRYSLPLPPVPAGVFVMRNITLSAGIDIPFNGDPVSVALGFASRVNPFQLSVMMFGGGGYVEIQLDRDGLKLFEVALEFGAFVAVDFVVASGEVHALGGVRFTLDRGGTVTLTGYLRVGGCVEVLGLIAVSIELCLSLAYNSDRNALIGRATVVIEIDLTLWSDTVEIDSGEWVFPGGVERQHPLSAAAAEDALAQWRAYRAAFADDTGERAFATGTVARNAAAVPSTTDQVRVVFDTAVAHEAGRVVWSPDDRWVVVGAGLVSAGVNPNGLTVLDAESGETRWQIDDEYTCVDIAVSPDARRIAVSTYDDSPRPQRIRMLDAETGKESWQAPGVGRLSFSPDGSLLGIIEIERDRSSTFVLDASTGRRLHTEGRCLSTPMFSSDSRLLCTGNPALVDSRTGAAVWDLNEHHGFASASVFTTDDDGVLVASGRFGTIIVYELTLAEGTIVERSRIGVAHLATASTQIRDSIRFSPDRGTIAFIANDHIGLSTVADGRTVFLHEVPPFPKLISMSFRPDGKELAVNHAVLPSPAGQPAPGLVVVDTATGALVWSDAGRTIGDLAYSAAGSRIAAGGGDFVRVYEVGHPVLSWYDCGRSVTMVAASAAAAGVVAAVVGGNEPRSIVFRAASGELLLDRIHAGTITALAVSPDGHSVATASSDGRCRHFDTLTRDRWAARHGGRVNAVAFSADSRWLATASSDFSARLFDRQLPADGIADDHQPRWAQRHPQSVTHIALGPNLAWVATAASDHKIRILAATNGAELHAFEHDGRVHALSVSATGILASASGDGSASVIDAATGQRRFRIEHPAPLSLVTLSRDGSLLATAGASTDVYIWQLDGDEAVLLHRFAARAVVTSLAFGADGRLAIATEHPVVQVLDAEAATETDRLVHTEQVNHLAFGLDGALLATGCDDHYARVYELRRP